MSNNPPYSILELTKEEHEFLLENCDKNIVFGLTSMQTMEHRPTIEKLVGLMEQFKAIKAKLEKAQLQ